MSSSVPLYDLSKLPSVYTDPRVLRSAYLHLARWAQRAERWEDMARVMREVVRASTAGLLGPTPQPNQSLLMKITGVDSGLPQPLQSAHGHAALFGGAGGGGGGGGGGGSSLGASAADPHDISGEERTLLFVAYKQLISALRQSWRAIHCGSEEVASGGREAVLVDEYRAQVEREISIVCTDLTQLLDTSLIATVTSAEGKVFYLKMAADFYRYLAEVSGGVTGLSPPQPQPSTHPASGAASPTSASSIVPSGYDKRSAEYYAAAHKIAVASLDPTHPTRLGLCLNYSVLLFEVLRDKKQACELARQSFDAAIGRLDEVEESNYRESTLLMQLLRDNLSLWTVEEP